MKFLIPLVLVLLVSRLSVQACLNSYVPNEKAIRESKTLLDSLTQHQWIEPWPARETHLRAVAHPTLSRGPAA